MSGSKGERRDTARETIRPCPIDDVRTQRYCTARLRRQSCPASPPDRTTPSSSCWKSGLTTSAACSRLDVALLDVAAAALALACPPGSEPLEYEGLTDRYLSDLMLSGRTLRHRTRYAVYAAACMRGGLHPDLLNEAGGWEPRLWTYAVSAVVLYTRAAADRRGMSVAQIATAIANDLGLPLTAAGQASD
jgi:hypothetical protein